MKKIGILTGGGDCPGLNAAIRGVVYAAEKFGFSCIGILEGWKGMIEKNTMVLRKEDVAYIIFEGGTILGTSRTNPFKKEENVKKVLDNFKSLDLYALVAIGGEDTLGVATRFYEDYKMNVVGVPKTMDNDLNATDYTFGFDTAVTRAMEAAKALIDTGRSHRRVMVFEVMGRHAGWVALFTAIASASDYVCLPEKKVDPNELIKKVKDAYSRKKFALVVVSEAVEMIDEEKNLGSGEVDQFGHTILKERGVGERIAKFIEKNTGIETRHAVIGHMQRGGEPTLFDRILATRVGIKAAELVRDGDFGKMAALCGNEIKAVPLKEATGQLKLVDNKWIEIMDILF
jgi:6-phosphofructokinase 1